MGSIVIDKNYKEYELFYVAEEHGRIKLKLSDIIYVKTDELDSRNKQIILKALKRYTLMNCTLEQLLNSCPLLVRVNKSEVISLEIIYKIEHDLISLEGMIENGKAKQVTLSRAYREEFFRKLEYYASGQSRL